MIRSRESIIGAIKRRHAAAKNVAAADVAGPDATAEYREYENRPPQINIYANTATVDLDREVIVPEGCDVDTYMKRNRAVFVDHNYAVTSAVGKMRSLTLDRKGWRMEVQLIDTDSEYGRAVVRLAKAGILASSVGAERIKYGPPTADEKAKYPGAEIVTREWRMLEVSFTAMPVNVDARMISATGLKSRQDAAANAIRRGGLPDYVLDAFRIPRRTVTVII